MLDSLYVKNLALIEKAEICFTKGLNVLSGETGAGKSIVIGSVLIALGAKVPKDMIRKDASEAYIELVFSPEKPAVLEALAQLDIVPEEGQLIISKRITASKSISKINGETYPASKVREAAALLLDVHGQRDHQAILQPHNQLAIVDRAYHQAIVPAAEAVRSCYEAWKKLQEELSGYQIDENERMRQMDILQYELNELEEAAIVPGEEEELAKQYKQISAKEELYRTFQELLQLLGYDAGACSQMSQAQMALKQIADKSEIASALLAQLMDVESILSDASREIQEQINEMEDDERNPEEIAKRLDEIRHLMQKYRCDENGLLQLQEQKQKDLEKMQHFAEQKELLEKACRKSLESLEHAAEKLSRLRKESAKRLEVQLKEAMIHLNFLDVQFEIHLQRMENITANGRDHAVFCISTNPGEALKPMTEVASGGELSRIMLAIKSVLAQKEDIETLIFDEIDTGISGRTAQKVADCLAKTANGSQIICISHLSQIVSMADTHFLIEKTAQEDRTTTRIEALSEEEQIREIARLLGGTQITQSVLDTAREMKDMANRTKEYQSMTE